MHPGVLHDVMGRRIEGISGKQRISEGIRKLLTGYVARCYSNGFLESVTAEESLPRPPLSGRISVSRHIAAISTKKTFPLTNNTKMDIIPF
jgi:hypothetical protein